MPTTRGCRGKQIADSTIAHPCCIQERTCPVLSCLEFPAWEKNGCILERLHCPGKNETLSSSSPSSVFLHMFVSSWWLLLLFCHFCGNSISGHSLSGDAPCLASCRRALCYTPGEHQPYSQAQQSFQKYGYDVLNKNTYTSAYTKMQKMMGKRVKVTLTPLRATGNMWI